MEKADAQDRVPVAEAPRPGVLARAALVVLRGYKLLLSPLFAGACRFTPSCADYTAEAVRRHGALWGTLLGARRLAHCHPLGPSGFDPVPLDKPRVGVRNPWRERRSRIDDRQRRSQSGPANPGRVTARMQ